MKAVTEFLRRLLELQSFERPRLRDLYRIRIGLLAALPAIVGGLVAEFADAEKAAQAAGGLGLAAKLETAYDFIFELVPWALPSTQTIFSYPGLPVAAVVGGTAYTLFKTSPLKGIISKYFLPDPPAFLDTKLESEREDEIDWRKRGKPFVGRESELAALRDFADEEPACQIWALCGQSGLGKSHLSATWLKELYVQGWDVGRFDGVADPAKIKEWRPRANTAIVFDRVAIQPSEWNFLYCLVDAARSSKHKIRILALTHTPPKPPDDLDAPVLARLRAAWRRKSNAHILQPVDSSFVHTYRREQGACELSHEQAQKIVEEFDGLTIYVAMKATDKNSHPRALILDRANAALARAQQAGAPELLAMSALAGPVRLPRVGDGAWTEPDFASWATLFPRDTPARELQRGFVRLRQDDCFELPAYAPQIEGDEVVLAYLAGLMRANADGTFDTRWADEFLERAVACAGDAVLDHIQGLLGRHTLVELAWRRGDGASQPSTQIYADDDERARLIAGILALDACLLRYRHDKILAELARLASIFKQPKTEGSKSEKVAIEEAWRAFLALRNLGIGDADVAFNAAGCSVDSISAWNRHFREATDDSRRLALDNIEDAAAYLRVIADLRFAGNSEIAEQVSTGMYNAVSAFGTHSAFSNDSQRSAALGKMDDAMIYLRHLCDDRFVEVSKVGVSAAAGAANAILYWGIIAERADDPARSAAMFGKMKEAMAYLRGLADRRFPRNRAVAEQVARGAMNASLKLIATIVSRPSPSASLQTDMNEQLEAIITYLRDLADRRFPENIEIATRVADSVSDEARMWGQLWATSPEAPGSRAARDRMEVAMAYLHDLADQRFPKDPGIVAKAARGEANIIKIVGDIAETSGDVAGCRVASERIEVSMDYLRDLADERFPKNCEIAMYVAVGAFNAALKLWGLALISSDVIVRSKEIELAVSLFAYLHDLADRRHPADAAIALRAAKAANTEVIMWGRIAETATDNSRLSDALDKMEDAVAYLRELADTRHKTDIAIAVEAAKGAANSTMSWARYGDSSRRTNYRDWLRQLRDRCHHPEINYIAALAGV